MSLIQIKNANLSLSGVRPIWDSVNFELNKGEIHIVVGESGSGKSTLGFSIFGIFPKNSKLTSTQFEVLGHSFLREKMESFQDYVRKFLFMVPQNPNLAFHPYRKLSAQMNDFLKFSGRMDIDSKAILELWGKLEISDPTRKWNSYPAQLSGGEKQRICLSLAFLKRTQILVLDEPTTGLDAMSEKIVLDSVKKIAKTGVAVLFITHDLRIAESIGTKITIMKEGTVLETKQIVNQKFEPITNYGKELLTAYQLFL